MFVETKSNIMKTNKNNIANSISRFSKIIVITVLSCQSFLACQSDDSIDPPLEPILIALITNSGNSITMDGIWSSGCVEANNNMILNESLTFNNENLQIDIKGYNNLQCNGTSIFSETIIINYRNAGSTTVNFMGEQVMVNQIEGSATSGDGSVEDFKQTFLIDDSGDDIYMYHALFGKDGGQVNAEGYPIEIIPISIMKTN